MSRTNGPFDRDNPRGQDTYRVSLDAQVGDQAVFTSNSPAIMTRTFLENFPEIETALRLDDTGADMLVTVGDQSFYESGLFEADSTVFDVFAIPLLSGDPQTALNRPGTVVLSKSVAERYFPGQEAVGRSIRIDNRTDYEVTGVMVDPRVNSHFRPRILTSFLNDPQWDSPIWLNNSYATYIRLRPGSDPDALEAKFPDFQRRLIGPQVEQFLGQSWDNAMASGFRYTWVLEPMPDIYLRSTATDQIGQTGDIRYLYILSAIAGFVLLLACINFMNLSTARATGRAREVGVRKVLGSEKAQLIRQFLGESVSLALLSMVIGFGLIALALPVFSDLAGVDLHIGPGLVAGMLVTAMITGLLAGLYPAFVLSAFQPVVVLKGAFSRSKSGTALRSALVVFQFAVTIVLLIGTAVVFRQMRFIQSRDLGFDAHQVMVVPIETEAGLAQFESFRSQLMEYPMIQDVASSGILPGPDRIHNFTGFHSEGMRDDDMILAGLGEVSDRYVETLGLRMVAGRDFDAAISDSLSWVVNEAAAASMGYTPEEAIGKTLARAGDTDGRIGTIIGVSANAHFTSLHDAVPPLVFGSWREEQQYGIIRFDASQTAEALSLVEQRWASLEPGYPFRYFFLDADYQKFYEREAKLGTLYLYFTILAVLIAALGLFGLASHVTSQRTREIGVRKALGATAGSIVSLLTREFTVLVLIACVVAFPVAWFAMSRWLSGFAFAVSLGWEVFALSGLSAIAVAWLTVSYQSIRAALTDPVRALHHD